MPISTGAALALGGGAILGGIVGGQRKRQEQTQISQLALSPEGALERQGRELTAEQLSGLRNLTALGPGGQDVSAGVESRHAFANLLGGFAGGGFLPSAQDIQTAQTFTGQVFAPQQTALTQQFEQQRT